MDISGKINAKDVKVYRDVSNAANALDIPSVVVGAAARDLVLHHGYGARIVRATTDIDFGIQVADATAYESLMARLEASGYKKTDKSHRLVSPDDLLLDLVPFGSIANAQGDVILPPDETHKMNIVGFQEACDSADQVTIQTNPKLVIPVASPPGVALLKLIAWTYRAPDIRQKDAADLAYLMENYEKIPRIVEAVYEESEVIESFDWDLTLASAFELGKNTKEIASEIAQTVVKKILDGEIKLRTIEVLQDEMCRNGYDEAELERKSALLDAFFQGFFGQN